MKSFGVTLPNLAGVLPGMTEQKNEGTNGESGTQPDLIDPYILSDAARLLRQANAMTRGEESGWPVFKVMRRLARKAKTGSEKQKPAMVLRSETSKVNRRSSLRMQREVFVDDDAADPFVAHVTPEDLAAAKQIFEHLDDHDRRLVELLSAGYDAKEIAALCGTSHDAMRQRIHRTRTKLRGLDMLLGGALILLAITAISIASAAEVTGVLFVSAASAIVMFILVVFDRKLIVWRDSVGKRQPLWRCVAHETGNLLARIVVYGFTAYAAFFAMTPQVDSWQEHQEVIRAQCGVATAIQGLSLPAPANEYNIPASATIEPSPAAAHTRVTWPVKARVAWESMTVPEQPDARSRTTPVFNKSDTLAHSKKTRASAGAPARNVHVTARQPPRVLRDGETSRE